MQNIVDIRIIWYIMHRLRLHRQITASMFIQAFNISMRTQIPIVNRSDSHATTVLPLQASLLYQFLCNSWEQWRVCVAWRWVVGGWLGGEMKDATPQQWRCDGSRGCVVAGAPGSHVRNNRQTRPLSRDTATSGTTNSPFVVPSHALYQFISFCDTPRHITPLHRLTYFFCRCLIPHIYRYWVTITIVKMCGFVKEVRASPIFGRNSRERYPFSSKLRLVFYRHDSSIC